MQFKFIVAFIIAVVNQSNHEFLPSQWKLAKKGVFMNYIVDKYNL